MQELRIETKQFLSNVQTYSRRQLNFSQEVGQLIELTNQRGLEQVFLDAIFHAKFATKTKEVMNRIGRDGEGFDKLSVEFQNSVEKVCALLKTVVKESSEEIKQHFVRDFFTLDQTSFSNFLKLLEDLSWMKNWEVDGKPLPLVAGPTAGTPDNRWGDAPPQTGVAMSLEDIGRISKGSRLGLILMLLLILLDPPVSLVGWGIVAVVCALLLYIVVVTFSMIRKTQNLA